MSVKAFFKSNAFKCIAALLCILLISGAFLTIAYAFLEVTAGERLQRAIKKIYGTSVTVYGADDKQITDKDTDPKGILAQPVTVGYSQIEQLYRIVLDNEENYLVESTGKQGYGGGTVTCWVALEFEETTVTGIKKVTVSSSKGQSFIGKITQDMLDSFTKDFDGESEFTTEDGYLSAGASASSNAICNAVNGAVKYVKAFLSGEEIKGPYDDFEEIDISGINFNYPTAEIVKLYFDGENGNYIVLSTGKQGYQDGTVTLAVTFKISGNKVESIEKIAVDDFDKQTLMNKFDDDYFNNLAQNYKEGIIYSEESGYLTAGATKTSKAICNSVDGAVSFIKTYLEGGNV